MKVHFVILLTLVICSYFNSQKLKTNYILFSTNENGTEYIEFKNDSILLRKPYFSNTHCNMARIQIAKSHESIYKEYLYKKSNDSITIYYFENVENVSYKVVGNEYFWNEEKKEVYVLRALFDDYPDLAVNYKNQFYWIDSPKTSNGVVIKNGKKNRKLAKMMKNIKAETIDIEIHKGYEAFEKFGYKYVFRVIELKDKPQN